jgi:tetratricopeptide (TPR) repeat protein
LLERAGEADPLILAGHFERGGMGTQAADYYIRGAEVASSRRDDLDAERWYAKALELAGELPISAQRGRGLARFRIGEHAEAVAVLAAAQAQAAMEGNNLARTELLLDEAMVLDWLGEYQKAEERVLAAKRFGLDETSPIVEARLLLGLGRSSVRSNRSEQAADELARAAKNALALGDEGYETCVIALFMLGFILPGLGRLDEAAAALDQANRYCDERGDLLHLGGVLSNRALVRGYRGDSEGAVADFEGVIALGRKLGQPRIELIGQYNLAEYLYFIDDTAAAEPHLTAAETIAQNPKSATSPEIVKMLAARVKLYQGDIAGAAQIVRGIREAQAAARAKNGSEILAPTEDVFARVIELATGDSADEQWNEVEARAATCAMGQEQIEVLEARALWLMRHGRLEEAERRLIDVLELSKRTLTVMVPRLRRFLDAAREQLSKAVAGEVQSRRD